VTLAIAVLVVTLGVPSLQELIRNNRMVSQANELVTDLNIARSEAIKRGVRVTLCKSSNASTCTSDAQWESGWLVFTDPDKDGTYDGSPEQVILVSTGLQGGNTLRTGDTFSRFVSYTPTGESRGTGGNTDTFSLCDARGATKGRAVMINAGGRIRMEKGVSSCP
jgi:type IV fimbrial biogenesis protein FimT